MANANWSNPTLTSTYTNFVSEVKNRDEDLALQFDGTTSTNIPTGAVRWDSGANRWKKWNGSIWAELTATYALTALSTTGNTSIGGTLIVTGATTLSAGGTSTTAAADTNSTAIATTAFVVGQAGTATPLVAGTASFGISLRYSRQDHVHPTDTSRAPLASPTFTGTVTIPAGASISGYAPLADPTFTGVPAAPTAALGTNTTQVATTAYVKTEIAASTAANVSGTVAIANGGTGQTTAANAINALVPSQTGNSGKVLGTNGSVVSWVAGSAGNYQPFDGNGTWTKPSSGTFALIRCWGGGGSGAKSTAASGGGGGGCMERLMLLSDLPATVTVTIGNGGAAITGANANGNIGGDTTFGAYVTGDGGQGGFTGSLGGNGGGGKGLLFAGGSGASAGLLGTLEPAEPASYGGGGGGYTGTAGSSSYGGGGGGGRNDNTVRAAGSSEYGGAGGNGGGAGAGVAGAVPGGGGGASATSSGAGGSGRCTVHVF